MSNPTNNHTSNPYNLVTPYTNERRQLNEEKKTEEKKTSDQSITSATNAIASVRIGNLQQQIPNPTNTIAAARVSSLQPQVPRGANAIDSLDVSSSRPIIPLTFTFVRGPDARGAQNSQSPDTLLPPQNSSNHQTKAQEKKANKPSSFNTLPSEILQTILRFSDEPIETLKTISKELNNQTNETMESFWLEKFENPEILNANPEIDKRINTISDVLLPAKKLQRLHRYMVTEVRNINPRALPSLQFQNRVLDFSLYQQLPQIVALSHLQNAMERTSQRERLPRVAHFSPEELRDSIRNSRNNNIRWLEIDGVDITELPPEIQLLTSVRGLSVQNNNRFTALPNGFSMPNLENLSLSNTRITTLPNNLNLPNLLELNLSHTPISTWPNHVNLPNLGSLNLSHTRMTTLLDNLPELQTLGLSGSQIATLPEQFDLPMLSFLFLENTPLVQTEEGRQRALDWGNRHRVDITL